MPRPEPLTIEELVELRVLRVMIGTGVSDSAIEPARELLALAIKLLETPENSGPDQVQAPPMRTGARTDYTNVPEPTHRNRYGDRQIGRCGEE